MQNYRADPVGPAGVCGVPRGTEGKTSGGHGEEEREGRGGERGATRGSGSISTHLNFGPSQGQYGRTTRPPSSSSLRHLVRFLFFLVRVYSILSVSLFLTSTVSLFFPLPPLPCFHDGVRTALSRHTVLGPTPSSVCRRINVSFLFASDHLTILRNPN